MSRGDARQPGESFGIEVEHYAQDPQGRDKVWSVGMGHQCDGWEIANGNTPQELVVGLDRFIAELQTVRDNIVNGTMTVDHGLCDMDACSAWAHSGYVPVSTCTDPKCGDAEKWHKHEEK